MHLQLQLPLYLSDSEATLEAAPCTGSVPLNVLFFVSFETEMLKCWLLVSSCKRTARAFSVIGFTRKCSTLEGDRLSRLGLLPRSQLLGHRMSISPGYVSFKSCVAGLSPTLYFWSLTVCNFPFVHLPVFSLKTCS